MKNPPLFDIFFIKILFPKKLLIFTIKKYKDFLHEKISRGGIFSKGECLFEREVV